MSSEVGSSTGSRGALSLFRCTDSPVRTTQEKKRRETYKIDSEAVKNKDRLRQRDTRLIDW